MQKQERASTGSTVNASPADAGGLLTQCRATSSSAAIQQHPSPGRQIQNYIWNPKLAGLVSHFILPSNSPVSLAMLSSSHLCLCPIPLAPLPPLPLLPSASLRLFICLCFGCSQLCLVSWEEDITLAYRRSHTSRRRHMCLPLDIDESKAIRAWPMRLAADFDSPMHVKAGSWASWCVWAD